MVGSKRGLNPLNKVFMCKTLKMVSGNFWEKLIFIGKEYYYEKEGCKINRVGFG
jgi:hypothetical protein